MNSRILNLLSLVTIVVLSCTPKTVDAPQSSSVSESPAVVETSNLNEAVVNTEERTGSLIEFAPFIANTFHSKSKHGFLGIVKEGEDIYLSLKDGGLSLIMNIFTDRPILFADLPKNKFTSHNESTTSVLSYNDRQIEFYLTSSGSINVYFGASHKYENPWDDLVFSDRIESREVPAGDPIIQNDQYQTSAIVKVIAGTLPTEDDMKYGYIPDYFHRLPLDYAIRSSNQKLYSLLLITDASRHNHPQSDQSLLQTCIDNRDYEGLDFLLENGFDPYASNPTGSEINNYPLVSSLIDAKALSYFLNHIDIEKRFQSYRKWYKQLTFQTNNDEDGTIVTTLLGFAVLAGKEEVTKMLISRGAKTDAKIEFQPFGDTPKSTVSILEKLK